MASTADARLGVGRLGALEAHGTGTALGDPIEAGAVVAIFLAQRPMDPFVAGSLKANAGHTEPGAGLAGTLKLLMQLCDGAMSPNTQLRSLNPHVGASLRSHMACVLPTQPGALYMPEGEAVSGGVSSFGYSGTIAHAVLRHAGGDMGRAIVLPPLVYRRRSFPWREVSASSGAERTSMYSACWVSATPVDVTPSRSCLLLTASTTMVTDGTPAAWSPWHAVAVLLAGDESVAPSLHGMHLVLGFVQHLVGLTTPPPVLVFTSGAVALGGASSCEANGGTWGFARVLLLEHPMLRTQTTDVPRLAANVPFSPIVKHTTESEAARIGNLHLVARLRACTASSMSSAALKWGSYAVTGGLGGLGLRAASLLVEGSSSRVLLASRSGRVMRDGQGLEAQLQSMGAVAIVLDSAGAR